ncbi:hypothetical protein JOF41_004824 [Saccharothrix coeruleofusca]|uniref:DUF397 domain-containing protein n=1 Tax=Saccharothrix coeruleofusca TaxID=33919 RepID=UPI001AEB0383|nr:DUF397 domain-containing protein [Saccharothrix coeruleofusca]MBP2338646.1 hypothetical protein [Saccharothrix coeruleofusca]
MSPRDTGWFKSVRSSANGPACVEVRITGVVAVRDSKNATGSISEYAPAVWRAFLEAVKSGRFDN